MTGDRTQQHPSPSGPFRPPPASCTEAKDAGSSASVAGVKEQNPAAEESTARHSGSLRSRVISGAVWTFAGYGAGMILRLLNSVILSRLLFPDAFGVMTLVTAFVQAIGMFSDVGADLSVIQSDKGDDPDFLNTAWTIQILRGFGIWTCVLIGAYPFALAYGEPHLTLLVAVVGFREVISGFCSMKFAVAKRHMRIGRLTMIGLGCQLIGLIVTIVAAWYYQSVWSLVVGTLIGELCRTVLSHLCLPGHRSQFRIRPEYVRLLMNFGKWVFLSTALTFFVQMSDRLIFGQIATTAMLGVYGIAANFSAIPATIVRTLARAVAFPAYSRRSGGGQDIGTLFHRMRGPVVVAGGAGIVLLALLAPFLIRTLYDARYHQATWMLQVLCVSAWFQVLESNIGVALLALGHSRLLAIASGAKLVGMLTLMPLGYYYFGFPGAVAGYSASEMGRYFISAVAAQRRGIAVLALDSGLTLLGVLTLAAGYGVSSLQSFQELDVLTAIGCLTGTVALFWSLPAIRVARVVRQG